MAAAAAHSIPPFPLPAIPRVRPPPIPKGTPGPNTLTQPGPPPKKNLVWADGRWASPHSRSALHKKEVVSKQLEKALQHEVHGMNIYAYKHIRTHQVVYSLTKNMDNTKILKQLLYHGKKTVPAALRRDVWRPYFSVHFPRTPAGSMKGLRVFQELREMSALRQLKPPKELTIATQEDLDNLKKGFDPVEWLEKTENVLPNTKLLQPPVVGERLPRKMLAKRLMNQAATSVADIAAILTRQTTAEGFDQAQRKKRKEKQTVVKALGLTPQQTRDQVIERKKAHEEALSIRASNRLAEIRKKEEAKAEQLRQRQQYLAARPGMVKIDDHTTDRISIEYDGVGQTLTMIDEADRGNRAENGASAALRVALENIENEKQVQTQNLEKSMGAQIEQRLMELTESERSEIEKEVEAERAQRQSEIDAQVSATRDEYKQQRLRLYEQEPASIERTRALRKLSRDSQAEVYKLKRDLRTRYLKWAGPFASIATEVDKAMSTIDANWEATLAELREKVEAEKEDHANPDNHEVEIRWANLRDGTYAESWPETVFHAELEPKAVSKKQGRAVTTHFHYDVDEEPIETQVGSAEVPRRSTVHVFGSASPDADANARAKGRYESPSDLLAQRLEKRAMRVQEWANTEAIIVRDRIVAMRTECAELERLFKDIKLDEEATPYIASSMEVVAIAREIVDVRMKIEAYDPQDLVSLDEQLTYIRGIDSICRDEIANSANEIADEARVKYALLQADLMALESRNHEARIQAVIFENFIAKCNERQGLEIEVGLFKDDPRQYSIAVNNLEDWDLNNPFIRNMLARREESLETLPADIEDSTAEISRLEEELDAARTGATEEVEQSETIKSLEQQLKSERESLQSMTAELKKLQDEDAAGQEAKWKVIREDKQAWLEFKRANTGIPLSTEEPEISSSAPTSEGGMVMEQPKEPKPEGVFGRVKNLFKRGR